MNARSCEAEARVESYSLFHMGSRVKKDTDVKSLAVFLDNGAKKDTGVEHADEEFVTIVNFYVGFH